MTCCSISGCGRIRYARGWCRRHYDKWRYSGDPLFEPVDEVTRFWSKVDRRDPNDCWGWQGYRFHDGYGEFKISQRSGVRAHRYAFENSVGTIPDGMVIDHRCFNRACCNPAHLRLATPKQNMENRQGTQSNCKSGIRGVVWDGRRKKWKASITHNLRHVHVGYFATLEDAERAVIARRNELFTHNLKDRTA